MLQGRSLEEDGPGRQRVAMEGLNHSCIHEEAQCTYLYSFHLYWLRTVSFEG